MRSTALQPDHAYAHFNLGILLQQMGEAEAAAQAIETAFKIDPSLKEAVAGFGDAAEEEGGGEEEEEEEETF